MRRIPRTIRFSRADVLVRRHQRCLEHYAALCAILQPISALPYVKPGRAQILKGISLVTFLTPGILPSAPSGPAPLFAPLLRRSVPAKKVTRSSAGGVEALSLQDRGHHHSFR